MAHEITITKRSILIDPDIDDLMVTALEGGINYWCDLAKAKLVPDGIEHEYLSDLISRGGVIELHDEVMDERYDLNLSKFLNGVTMACEHYGFNSAQELLENHDAEVADVIIQFAIFGEIKYG